MYRCQARYGALVGVDREIADGLSELNELRRSRSLPAFEPTTTSSAVLPRRPTEWRRRWCRQPVRV